VGQVVNRRDGLLANQAQWAPKDIGLRQPNHARVYDYFLGGKDNFAADRDAAERIAEVAPDTPLLARANRGFLVRAVRFFCESGIRQFVDLGTGIPTSPSLHEVVGEIDPSARVVYIDNDPVVVAHNNALLANDDSVIAVDADIRRPDLLFADPKFKAFIDFSQPVAVLFVAMLHLVTEAQRPASIVAAYRDIMAPGSFVAISQFSSDSTPDAITTVESIYADHPTTLTFRSRAEIGRFFEGFELVPPGLVDVENWRSERDAPKTRLKIAAGVGRKP
jgi:hypothetical protein